MSKGDEHPSAWDSLVPQLIHPFMVAILEAVEWIDRPLSAPSLAHLCDEKRSLSEIAYHLRKLADSAVLELVYERLVPDSFERFYALALNHGHQAP